MKVYITLSKSYSKIFISDIKNTLILLISRNSMMDKKVYKKTGWCSSVRVDRQKTDDDSKKIYIEKCPFPRRDHTLCFDPAT